MEVFKRTEVGQIEVSIGRTVFIELHCVEYLNGLEVARSNPHRQAFAPDADVSAILNLLNADITTRPGLMWPTIDPGEWDRVIKYRELTHTPEIKKAYAEWKLAEEKKLAEEQARMVEENQRATKEGIQVQAEAIKGVWAKAPKTAMYHAQQPTGAWIWFAKKPELLGGVWVDPDNRYVDAPGRRSRDPWYATLSARPA